MILFVPLILAAEFSPHPAGTDASDLPSFERFVADMTEARNHWHFPDWMQPDWLKFANGQMHDDDENASVKIKMELEPDFRPPRKVESSWVLPRWPSMNWFAKEPAIEDSHGFVEGLDAELGKFLRFLRNPNLSLAEGFEPVAKKINAYLKEQAVRIQRTVKFAIEKGKEDWISGVKGYASRLVKNAYKFPALADDVIAKGKVLANQQIEITDMATMVGLLGNAQAEWKEVGSFYHACSHSYGVSINYFAGVNIQVPPKKLYTEWMGAKILKPFIGEKQHLIQLIENLISLRKANWMLEANSQIALAQLVTMTPVGHRLALGLNSCIVDMMRCADGCFYGIVYEKTDAFAFQVAIQEIGELITNLATQSITKLCLTTQKLSLNWYKGGNSINEMVWTYMAPWNPYEHLAFGALWDYAKTLSELKSYEVAETSIDIFAITAKLSPPAAQALLFRIKSLPSSENQQAKQIYPRIQRAVIAATVSD